MTSPTPLGLGGLFLLIAMLFGCPADPPTILDAGDNADGQADMDSGTDASEANECRRPEDCDDGLACNGAESCVGARCVGGIPIECDDGIACTYDQCIESTLACRHAGPDLDGDGHADVFCRGLDGLPLGDDCDDQDADRYPGNTERCDGGHDEDCDLTTFGGIDADSDTHASTACCNTVSGVLVCGDDCDDQNANVRPNASEICNNVDDDCDGLVDDVLGGTVFCTSGLERICTSACGETGMQACAADCLGWDACESREVCNGCDDDQNGVTDDGFECAQATSEPCTTACGSEGSRLCTGACEWEACRGIEQCNYCDDDLDGDWLDDAPLARDISETWESCDLSHATGVCLSTTAHDFGGRVTTTSIVTLLEGTSADESGAYWFPIGRLGFGAVVVRAEIRSFALAPGLVTGGISVVLAGAGDVRAGPGTSLGIPLDRTGLAFQWRWHTPRYRCCTPTPTSRDTGKVYRLADGMLSPRGDLRFGPDTADLEAPASAGFDGAYTVQILTVRYTPDDPTTELNEERASIRLEAPEGPGGLPGDFEEFEYTANDDLAFANLEGDLTVGQELYVGITAGTHSRSLRGMWSGYES